MGNQAGLLQMAPGALLSCLGHDEVFLTSRILGPSPVQRSGATQIKLTFGGRSWRPDAMIPHAAGGLERARPIYYAGF